MLPSAAAWRSSVSSQIDEEMSPWEKKAYEEILGEMAFVLVILDFLNSRNPFLIDLLDLQ